MQKTSIAVLGGFYDPVALPTDFPVSKPAFSMPPRLPHVHDCFEIGLCRAGAGIFLVEEKIYHCQAGDAVFINHREFHMLEKDSPLNSEWRFINLDPGRLLAGWIPPGEAALDVTPFCGSRFVNLVRREEHRELVDLVEILVREMEREEEGYGSAVRGLIWAILVQLRRLVPAGAGEGQGKRRGDVERFYPALAHVSAHYAEDIRMPELAALCHASISTFRRGFRRAFGCLPQDYLAEFRLNVALALLTSTDFPVAQIALDAGFPTLSNFNRKFKARFSCTPMDARTRKVNSNGAISCMGSP
jgi:AraC-like DNA-binding protein